MKIKLCLLFIILLTALVVVKCDSGLESSANKKDTLSQEKITECPFCKAVNQQNDSYCVECAKDMNRNANLTEPIAQTTTVVTAPLTTISATDSAISSSFKNDENVCPACGFINNPKDRFCLNCMHEVYTLTDDERQKIQDKSLSLLKDRRKRIDDYIQKSLPYIKIRNLNAAYRPLMEALSKVDEALELKESHIEKLTNEIEKVFGFKIYYRYKQDFQLNKFMSKNQASCDQAKLRDIVRMYTILDEFFAAYPLELIRKTIKSIYVVENYEDSRGPLNGIAFSHDSSFWVSTKSQNRTVPKKSYLRTFHHEFNHLLFFRNSLSEKDWISLNPPDFTYVSCWEENLNLPESKLNNMGFVRAYGTSAFVEDLATFAEILFVSPDKLIFLAKKYPAIRGKLQILVNWYTKLGVEFELPKF